ncbi:MAG TPA: hypothetical protein VFK96_09245 [Gammaproteobacteria bacterium]|nr:hypothetical protein [Gammaproteobacteria bacterium]
MTAIDPVVRRSSTAFIRASRWVEKQRNQFALPQEDKDGGRYIIKHIKPLGELLFALCYIKKYGIAANFVDDYAKWAWGQFSEGDKLAEMLLARPDLLNVSVLYAWFRTLGYVNRTLEGVVSYILNSRFYTNNSMLYYRRLEVDMAMRFLTNRKFTPAVAGPTLIASEPEPWIISEDVAYTITHEVFYLTDMGNTPELLPQSTRRYLKIWLPMWLDIFRKRGNWDIYGELLIVASLIDDENTYAEYVPDFFNVQSKSGVFPGPSRDKRAPVNQAYDKDRKFFLMNYHTTLVGLIALASHVKTTQVTAASPALST